MSKYYEKSVSKGEKFLYDSDGKCIGRGVTDKNGKTVYSGAGGYVGKSYETGQGIVKHYDSNNNYVGSGIKRNNVSTIQGNDTPNANHRPKGQKSSPTSKPEGEGCFVALCWAAIIGAIISILNTLA